MSVSIWKPVIVNELLYMYVFGSQILYLAIYVLIYWIVKKRFTEGSFGGSTCHAWIYNWRQERHGGHDRVTALAEGDGLVRQWTWKIYFLKLMNVNEVPYQFCLLNLFYIFSYFPPQDIKIISS